MIFRLLALGSALSALTGCHLFQDLKIDCVQGMACAGGDDTADGDTGTPVGPQVGWIVSRAQDEDGHAEAFGPDGTLLQSWSGLAALLPQDGVTKPQFGAPVAFNPATGAGAIAMGGTFAALGADGDSARTATYTDTSIVDIEVATGRAWLATGTDVLSYDYTAREEPTTSLFGAGLKEAYGIALAGDRLFVSDCGDGYPDLYTVDVTTGSIEDHLPDFAPTCGEGGNVFVGPDDEPWHCGPRGDLFRVADLVAGQYEPAVAVENFNDVRDCGYDPGDGSFLLFDGTRGVYRRTADGPVEPLWAPPEDAAALRSGFFLAG